MIRWIFDRSLGTGPAEQSDYPGAFRIDVRHLLDAPGNDIDSVLSLIEAGEMALREGRTVLVLCDFGVSRSNAIAAGILSRFKSIPFSDAIQHVINQTGEPEIKLSMIDTVRDALGHSFKKHQGSKIAVTGATGAIGSAIIDQLGADAVALMGRADHDLKSSPARLAACLDAAGVCTIIHAAHPRVFSNNATLGDALHLQKNVMDAAASIGADFVLLSCSSVFGKTDVPVRHTPEARRQPSDIVGLVKTLQEDLISRHGPIGGPRARIVRLPAVYGPNSPRPKFLSAFCKAIMGGQIVRTHRFKTGPAAIELLHLSDAAAGIIAVASRGTEPVYHLGSMDYVTTHAIAAVLSEHLGKPLFHEEITLRGAGSGPLLDWSATVDGLGWKPSQKLDIGLQDVAIRYSETNLR